MEMKTNSTLMIERNRAIGSLEQEQRNVTQFSELQAGSALEQVELKDKNIVLESHLEDFETEQLKERRATIQAQDDAYAYCNQIAAIRFRRHFHAISVHIKFPSMVIAGETTELVPTKEQGSPTVPTLRFELVL